MLLRCIAACALMVFLNFSGHTQVPETKNVIIVTLDGLRWQELFDGADESIIKNKKYSNDQAVRQLFWHTDQGKRKEKLIKSGAIAKANLEKLI